MVEQTFGRLVPWQHTQRLIDPPTLVKAVLVFSLHSYVTDPYAVHIVLTPKISTPPPNVRFYNQFANLKRNFLIDFSIQKLSVGIENFHLKPSLLEVKLFRKFIEIFLKAESHWQP